MSKTNKRGGHGEYATTPESSDIENALKDAVLRIRSEISNRFIIPVGDVDYPKKGLLLDGVTNEVVKKYINSGKPFKDKYEEWRLTNPSVIIKNIDNLQSFIKSYKKPFDYEVIFVEKGGKDSLLNYIDPNDYSACQPDGGFFCIKKDGKLIPIVASETKHQGEKGNAIERFFDNNIWSRDVNPNISYITFASGDGAQVNEVIHRTLYKRHHGKFGGFNDYYPGKNSCFMSVNGFSESFIYDILVKSIVERCKFYGL